ncbi:MAG: hypothetical protein RR075_04625, partial [Pygmaiobacter sp.]
MLKQITEELLANKGVKGQPDVPGLTSEQMQNKMEEIVRTVVIPTVNENATAQNAENANRYTKIETETAINNKMTAMGSGDMAKSVYDPQHKQQDVFSIVPTGAVVPFAGAAAPAGW